MRIAAPLLLLCASFVVTAGTPSAKTCIPAGIGQDSFCSVGAVRLHYVDWGGTGPVLLLLTGLGDSARIFDDFAPLLTRGHRVIAVTRRGYGASSAPVDGNYNNDALVADILGLMDALSIPRASFVGHSIAGGELAALGARHSDRVERLIYIDAAYDRTLAPRLMAGLPPLPLPDASVRRNLDEFAHWRELVLGVHSPAVRSNLSQIMQPGPDGLVTRAAQSTGTAVLAGDIAAKPQWDAIAAPSLAFFTSKDVPDQVPPAANATQRAAFVDYSLRFLRPWMLRAQADFLEQTRCAVAVEVPHSTHYLFLDHSQWTAEVILGFVSSEHPCHWNYAPTGQRSQRLK
ncbi:MAG: alpha/beta hydrolase [Proteobacteria bacterium]|nr:alpha/beta hydrolase [Pseudomonadota bacterium]